MRCVSVDVEVGGVRGAVGERARRVVNEAAGCEAAEVAVRGGGRWVRDYEAVGWAREAGSRARRGRGAAAWRGVPAHGWDGWDRDGAGGVAGARVRGAVDAGEPERGGGRGVASGCER